MSFGYMLARARMLNGTRWVSILRRAPDIMIVVLAQSVERVLECHLRPSAGA